MGRRTIRTDLCACRIRVVIGLYISAELHRTLDAMSVESIPNREGIDV
jgi:hypothetical protein